ncbi:MAG: CxxxxCH/CxxCH domain-containing protein [Myxococcota bacterium]
MTFLVACKGDPAVDTDTDTDVVPPPVAEGFLTGELCLVRTVFEVSCVTGCHSATVAGGGLDLQTDPHTALVNRVSPNGSGTLVAPGASVDSFLYRKMVGLIAEGEGDVMPPEGALDPFVTDIVKTWIDNGAVNDCDIQPPGGEPPPPPPPPPPEENVDPNEPHHPPNWADPTYHGVAANLQTDGDCRSCHGANLDAVGGTSPVSCDDCHAPGWRTDCTFCHGGTENTSGAPPKDIDGETNPAAISFTAHSAHIAEGYGCEQCHYKPTDVLTNGHIFGDVTPGYGEIDYTQGYSPIATYNAATGTCSNAYCHGSGRADDGTVSDGDGPLGCTSCHPNLGTPNEWNQMSGRHQLHLSEGAVCYECHANTVDAGNAIVGPDYHVNRVKDVYSNELTAGATCNGTCHNHNHANDTW